VKPRELLRTPRVALESYGANALRLRAQYEMRRRFGLYQAAPRVPHINDTTSNNQSPFDVDLDRVRIALNHSAAIDRADRVASGMYQAYRNDWLPLPRSGGEWSVHPHLGTQYPSEPWWEMRRFSSLDPSRGDVKDAWEPARFTWAFDLALGYSATRDEKPTVSRDPVELRPGNVDSSAVVSVGRACVRECACIDSDETWYSRRSVRLVG
jgi:hypothetical protein